MDVSLDRLLYLDYFYGATWSGQTSDVISTSGPGVRIVSSNGAAGAADIRLRVPASTNALVAGRYSDTLVVELRATN